MRRGQVWMPKEGSMEGRAARIMSVSRLRMVEFDLVDPETLKLIAKVPLRWPEKMFRESFEEPLPTRWDRLGGGEPFLEFDDAVDDGDA